MSESLWFDELWSTKVTLSPVLRWLRTVGADVHPPAYTTFMFCWVHLFGDSEICVRIPPLAASVGTIILIFLITRRLGSSGIALIAACLFALSPVSIWYATEARQYSAWVFCTTLSAYALLTEREGAKDRWRWVYAASILLAQGMHYYTIFLVIALSILAIVARPRVKWITHTNAAVAGIFFLYIVVKIIVRPPHVGYTGILGYSASVHLFGDWLPHGGTLNSNSNWIGRALQLFYLVLFGLGIAVLLGRRARSNGGWRSPASVTMIFLLSPVLGVMLTSSIFRTGYICRSVLIVLPFYLIVISSVVFIARVRWLSACLALLLVALALFSTVQLYQQDVCTVYKPNPDWRNAAGFIGSVFEQGDTPIQVICASSYLTLKYYLKADLYERLHEVRVRQAEGALTSLASSGNPEFCIVQNPGWGGRRLEEIIAKADSLCQRQATFRSTSIAVYYYSGHTEASRIAE